MRNSGLGHRCINQTLPGINNDCTCPPPEPEVPKVWTLLDRVDYEGDFVVGVYTTEQEAWRGVQNSNWGFTGIPVVLGFDVQGEPE